MKVFIVVLILLWATLAFGAKFIDGGFGFIGKTGHIGSTASTGDTIIWDGTDAILWDASGDKILWD